VQVLADRTDNDLPGIESDPDRYFCAVTVRHFLSMLLDVLLHPERRITSSRGMILVRDRSAEKGQDSITHDPVHGALVVVHRFDHAIEYRVQDLLSGFGVMINKQVHRTFDVGKQDRDLFTLALKASFRCENLIGEVLRSVIRRGGKAGGTPTRWQGRAALRTELRYG